MAAKSPQEQRGALPVNIIAQSPASTGAHAAVRRELASLIDYGRLELPMLPEHAARVVALAGQPDASALGLARLIASDQALAARVMKVARSAAYQPSSPINSLQHAIAWLGLGEVADIAFTAAVQGRLLNVPGQRPRAVRMWQVAVACAIWAREVAAMARRYSEVTYLCGLLHDIGKPVALLASADLAGKLGVRLGDDDYDALVHEFHAPLGLLLAQRWRLPEAVAECIRFWPDPSAATAHADEVRVVHLAHHVAELVVAQGADVARETLLKSAAVDELHIGPDRLKALIDRSDWVMGQVKAY
jgi:HD-like signal output (HDOD) protein